MQTASDTFWATKGEAAARTEKCRAPDDDDEEEEDEEADDEDYGAVEGEEDVDNHGNHYADNKCNNACC